MKIQLNWEGNGFEFEGADDLGNIVSIDGGRKTGLSPMSLILQAVGSCSAIDVLDILAKMRSVVDSLQVEVKGTRKVGEPPLPWTHIHIHFVLAGDLDPKKVERAVDLSMNKYCSATANLKGVTEISADFELV